MNKSIDEVKQGLDKAGHAIDDQVEKVSEKHGIEKWHIWLGLLIVVVVIVKWVL